MGQGLNLVARTVADPCCVSEEGADIIAHIPVTGPANPGAQCITTNVGDVYSITLHKAGGEKLGLDLDFVAEREAMPVRAVTGFLAEEWNREHPDNKVLPGDRVVEVNGTRGTAELMMKALKDSEIVKITFVRLRNQKGREGLDDWEFVRALKDRLEFEENMPPALYELVPYQGDTVAGEFGQAVTGQIKSTATVIPWGDNPKPTMPMAELKKPETIYERWIPEPKPAAVVLKDPRPSAGSQRSREVGVIGFLYPDRDEAWDVMCGAPFLGNSYDLGTASLLLEAPCERGQKRCFRNAEAAFQALKLWSIADEFTGLSGYDAALKSSAIGREDASWAGYGSSWKSMLAVLNAKFKAQSQFADGLVETGDAFLLEHHSEPGQDELWSNDHTGEGRNWLGLQLLLIRDQLSGEARWTEYISSMIDLDSGAAHSPAKARQWQDLVRRSTKALVKEIATFNKSTSAIGDSTFGAPIAGTLTTHSTLPDVLGGAVEGMQVSGISAFTGVSAWDNAPQDAMAQDGYAQDGVAQDGLDDGIEKAFIKDKIVAQGTVLGRSPKR